MSNGKPKLGGEGRDNDSFYESITNSLHPDKHPNMVKNSPVFQMESRNLVVRRRGVAGRQVLGPGPRGPPPRRMYSTMADAAAAAPPPPPSISIP